MAAVHALGGVTRVVAATPTAGQLSGLQARSFGPADAPSLARFLEGLDPELIVRLVPSSQTVCRTVTLPDAGADRAALADALALLAEAELPASVPAHRRAGGVIAPGRTPRQTALVVGWPQAPAGDTGPGRPSRTPDAPEIHTPEIVALAALAKAVGGCDLAALADRSTGAVAILASGESKTLARVLRLNSDSEAWNANLAAAIAETRRAAGLPEHAGSPEPRSLLIEPVPSQIRLAGAQRDNAWLEQFGLALGALLAAADADPAAAALVSLHAVPPRQVTSPLERLVRWCAAPRRGAALILLSLAAVLLVPFAAAHARHAVLLNRAGSIEDLDTRLAEAERRVAFYRVLRERRWPMTKLIADVAGAAPVGVTLETLELDQAGGASGGGSILIRGQAETTDLVTTFRENLAKTRVFSGLATPTVGATGDSVQFQLQARVTANAAVYPAPPAEDFAAKTLAQRLYEEGAAGLDEADPEADAEEPDAEAASREPAATPRSAPRETRSSRPPARPSQTAAVEIPPPLTDAEIAAMDALKAMSEFAKRRAAAYQRGLDQETVARLTEEADKCQRRMKEARPAQTGGPR